MDTDFDRVFYIAQKVAQGKSLEDLIESGWRVSEDKVKHVAMEVTAQILFVLLSGHYNYVFRIHQGCSRFFLFTVSC